MKDSVRWYTTITFLGLILLPFIASAVDIYPPCDRYQIHKGRWVDWLDPLTPKVTLTEIKRHFFYGDSPGFALNFSQIWLPYNCSYHRFTNHTVHQCLSDPALLGHSLQQPYHLVLAGDSATRNIFCGLSRIFSGSEYYGPCNNIVCGSHGHPISFRDTYNLFSVKFDSSLPLLTLHFMYFRSLITKNAEGYLEYLINHLHPQYLMLNTGAWDFDAHARHHPHAGFVSYCNGSEAEKIAQEVRMSTLTKEILYRIGVYTQQQSMKKADNGKVANNVSYVAASNVANQKSANQPANQSASTANKQQPHPIRTQLLYRTSHYNSRYSVQCADDGLLAYLEEINQAWCNDSSSISSISPVVTTATAVVNSNSSNSNSSSLTAVTISNINKVKKVANNNNSSTAAGLSASSNNNNIINNKRRFDKDKKEIWTTVDSIIHTTRCPATTISSLSSLSSSSSSSNQEDKKQLNKEKKSKKHVLWEVFDNREMSWEVWKEQNYDGFHFDRNKVLTAGHMAGHMKYFRDHKWLTPGMMEIQIAQALLHHIFHDCVQHFYTLAIGAYAKTETKSGGAGTR